MQPDMFGHVAQPERQPAPPPRKPLTPDDVRARMLELIATARAADAMPFDERELERHVAMFPIMAQWLDREEGERLVLAFEAEVERLRLAA